MTLAKLSLWVIGISLLSLVAVVELSRHFKNEQRRRNGGMASTCLGHMKQLSLAHLAYAADHDDRLALDAKLITPYVPFADYFACPMTRFEYAMNDQVLGVQISQLGDPAATVLMYEGIKNQLSGPHGGRSSVGYADGYVRFKDCLETLDVSVKLTGKN